MYPVPTMAEAGMSDMEITIWMAFLVPARTPAGIVRKLQEEVVRVVRLPEIREPPRHDDGWPAAPVPAPRACWFSPRLLGENVAQIDNRNNGWHGDPLPLSRSWCSGHALNRP